jgi:hypothetical protein
VDFAVNRTMPDLCLESDKRGTNCDTGCHQAHAERATNLSNQPTRRVVGRFIVAILRRESFVAVCVVAVCIASAGSGGGRHRRRGRRCSGVDLLRVRGAAHKRLPALVTAGVVGAAGFDAVALIESTGVVRDRLRVLGAVDGVAVGADADVVEILLRRRKRRCGGWRKMEGEAYRVALVLAGTLATIGTERWASISL